MRWTGVSIGFAVASFVVAAAWMDWVVSQGTNQLIQPGWWAFQYAGALLVALVLAVAALLTVKITKPTNHTVPLTVGVVAGLETLLFVSCGWL